MFNIGPGELMAIAAVALIVLGPQRLPQALRSVGRVVGELRRISGGFQDELRRAIDESDADADGADVTEGRPPPSAVGSAQGSSTAPGTAAGPAPTGSQSSEAGDNDEPDRMLVPAETAETAETAEPEVPPDDRGARDDRDALGDTDDASDGGGERAVS